MFVIFKICLASINENPSEFSHSKQRGFFTLGFNFDIFMPKIFSFGKLLSSEKALTSTAFPVSKRRRFRDGF